MNEPSSRGANIGEITMTKISAGSSDVYLPVSGMKLFGAEPRSSLAQGFRSVLSGVGSALGTASSIAGVDPLYSDLLSQQMEMQKQLQLVSLHSNVEKSRHESKMAAIRNVRSA
jgi:hypothetical protein